jgi:hypothetical protein
MPSIEDHRKGRSDRPSSQGKYVEQVALSIFWRDNAVLSSPKRQRLPIAGKAVRRPYRCGDYQPEASGRRPHTRIIILALWAATGAELSQAHRAWGEWPVLLTVQCRSPAQNYTGGLLNQLHAAIHIRKREASTRSIRRAFGKSESPREAAHMMCTVSPADLHSR